MPIAPLSDSASRAICSSLTLNDSVSVVKELIDNSLDSTARNIVVELSHNAVDVIQVKDDGVGIGVEDRKLLCKRGYTSKITTLEDLNELGGSSLGFRGEALASIAELSEAIVFTTRVEGETVGTLLRFDCAGSLTSSSSASHGTGTTVRVSNFLRNVPVRKQAILKHSTKILATVKKLLFDYAYARPTVRLQLRILKSPNEKANWSFAPCLDSDDLKSIASRIAPKDVVAHTVQRVQYNEDNGFGVAGLFASPNEALTDVSHAGQHISIDGRPLSTERGLARSLVKQYKKAVKTLFPAATSQPFLYLRITCPKGSYDVNVDPAKNEVLPEQPASITELLQIVYNELYSTSTNPRTTHDDGDSNQLLQHTPTLSSSSFHNLASQINRSTTQESGCHQDTNLSSSARPTYDDHCNDLHSPTPKNGAFLQEDTSEDIMDPKITNPFTLAQITARALPRKSSHEVVRDQSRFAAIAHAAEPLFNIRGATTIEARPRRDFGESLPTPTPSPEREGAYQNPGPPNRPWRSKRCSSDDELSDADHASSVRVEKERSRPSLLDDWMKAVNVPPTLNTTVTLDPIQTRGDDRTSDAKIAMRCSPIRRIGPASTEARKPFRPPLRHNSDILVTSNYRDAQAIPDPSRTTKAPFKNSSTPTIDEHNGITRESRTHSHRRRSEALADAMDFERGKPEAMSQNCSNFKNHEICFQQEQSTSATGGRILSSAADAKRGHLYLERTDPAETRSEHEAAGTQASNGDYETEPTIPPQPRSAANTRNFVSYGSQLDDQGVRAQRGPTKFTASKDPRALLLKELSQLQNTSEEGLIKPKAHRAKNSSLPLERMLPDFSTFNLTGHMQTTHLDLANLSAGLARTILHDKAYVARGFVQLAESDLQIADDVFLLECLASARKHLESKDVACLWSESDSLAG